MVLDRTHRLSSGERVRLRLARPSDRALLDDAPQSLRGWTVIATAFDGAHQRVVGFGAPDGTVVASDREVYDLINRALDEHARTWRSRVA
jgi:hypothetical protein